MKVNVIVETGKDSFSCFISESEKLSIGIHGSGKTVKDAMDDFRIAYEEAKAYVESKGEEFTELEFDFIFDVGAFFNYYPIGEFCENGPLKTEKWSAEREKSFFGPQASFGRGQF